MSLIDLAKTLVAKRIPGTRKGSDEPAYIHSIRVSDALARFGYGEDVVVAGALHDVVEDGATSLDELRQMGFNERIVELVRLCTHDDMIEGGDRRWIKMMAGLIDADDAEAWAIKIADITDNLKSSHTLSQDRRMFMYQAKAPFLLRLSWLKLADSKAWQELKQTVEEMADAKSL